MYYIKSVLHVFLNDSVLSSKFWDLNFLILALCIGSNQTLLPNIIMATHPSVILMQMFLQFLSISMHAFVLINVPFTKLEKKHEITHMKQ